MVRPRPCRVVVPAACAIRAVRASSGWASVGPDRVCSQWASARAWRPLGSAREQRGAGLPILFEPLQQSYGVVAFLGKTPAALGELLPAEVQGGAVQGRLSGFERKPPVPYMGGAGESRAGVDRIGGGAGLGCECGGPALDGGSRWRRRRSDRGCGGSFQTGATLPCRALCWSAPQTLPSVGPVLAWDRSGGLLELGEDVVGAAGDLARDGQGCAL